MTDLTFFVEIVKNIGFPAVIFIIWFLYHKSQVEILTKMLAEQSQREERNYQTLKELTEALQANTATICRMEYKIDTGYTCPILKKEISK